MALAGLQVIDEGSAKVLLFQDLPGIGAGGVVALTFGTGDGLKNRGQAFIIQVDWRSRYSCQVR